MYDAALKSKTPFSFTGTVIDHQDADSLKIEVQLGLGVWKFETVRLDGVNAPELHSADPLERARGQAALAFVAALAPVGSRVTVRIPDADHREKYGRLLATVVTATGLDLAAQLIATGHGKPYHGEKR